MPDVRCSVSNCSYWGINNLCKADAIHVDIDADTKTRMNEEYGDDLGSMYVDQDKARNKAETCCHTFIEKGA